ncbi:MULTISPECIES: Uma2 family endonuclease [Thermus]|uniref:Uma2 family endonuclease n=1 Tax=Thermus brockianus TaxID=56956 RepID=UPI001F47E6DA|nr:Uma2 family endonuclease [Thermus brockianus]
MVRPYRFSLEEFLRLPLPERGVELLEGEIYQMAPIGPRHAYVLNRWNRLFVEHFPGVLVQVQGPLAWVPDVYLEPDLVLLRLGEYQDRFPGPEDVLLVLEVADTSLAYDLDRKVPLYARMGVPEVWVQDLQGGRILVFRTPEEDHYRERIWLRPGECLAPLAFPEVLLEAPW